jgi:uncharacterized protein YutE (UPF0331/DUF86 family)
MLATLQNIIATNTIGLVNHESTDSKFDKELDIFFENVKKKQILNKISFVTYEDRAQIFQLRLLALELLSVNELYDEVSTISLPNNLNKIDLSNLKEAFDYTFALMCSFNFDRLFKLLKKEKLNTASNYRDAIDKLLNSENGEAKELIKFLDTSLICEYVMLVALIFINEDSLMLSQSDIDSLLSLLENNFMDLSYSAKVLKLIELKKNIFE